MLQRITNKLVRGPNFSVSVPDIHRVQYAEDAHTAFVEIEGGLGEEGQVNWLVYTETLHGWESPHQTDEMPSEKRAEILARIDESLNLLQMPHRFD